MSDLLTPDVATRPDLRHTANAQADAASPVHGEVSDRGVPSGGEPRRARFTVSQFWRMFRRGAFAGRRVELLDGEIFDVPAQEEPHAIGVMKTNRQADRVFGFGEGFVVRCQMTLSFVPLDSLPDPDVAVVPGDIDDGIEKGTPTSAVLIVEVSNSSIRTDRHRKARLYAAAGILDYWIVNVRARQIEVHRDPQPDAASKTGFSYASVVRIKEPGSIAPLAMPDKSIRVTDCLPRALTAKA